jgi:hypothetical protein
MNLNLESEDLGLIKTALKHLMIELPEKEEECKRLILYIEAEEGRKT